jgi:nitrogen fixation NifU-like protein
MTLRLDASGEHVTDVAFDGRGCAISQASASIMTDTLRGLALEQLRSLDPKEVIAELGVPIGPARLKCALLGYKVLQGAISGSAAVWPDEAEVLGDASGGGSAP